ncbi:hypothetical protein N9Q87_00735 [Porticoccaceae bacterium]|nr:hypothetical protein [Porticoccaceae bacterium]
MTNVIFISGVSIDRTPVVKYTIENLQSAGIHCTKLELKKSRFFFICRAFWLICLTRKKRIFFVGLQSLPLVVFASFFKIDMYYWFLESYSGKENRSLVLRLTIFERFVIWNHVIAIFPISARARPYSSYDFKKLIFIPNATKAGVAFSKREFLTNPIRIVFYGCLDESRVFINEFMDFIANRAGFELHIYGDSNQVKEKSGRITNIDFHPSLPHAELIKELARYHYTVVGYKPVDFNSEFCAPNKLFEAFSLSLPPIVNSGNPTLANFEGIRSLGVVYDFDHLDEKLLSILLDNEIYSELNKNTHKMYAECFHLENYLCQL